MTTQSKFRVSLPTAAHFFRTAAVVWFLCSATQAWSDSTLTLDTGISATVTLSGAGNSCTGNVAASPPNTYSIPAGCGATIRATWEPTDSRASLCKLVTCGSTGPCSPAAPCGNAVDGGGSAELSLPAVTGNIRVGWVTARLATITLDKTVSGATVSLTGQGNSCKGNVAASPPNNTYPIPAGCGAQINAASSTPNVLSKLCKLQCGGTGACTPSTPCGYVPRSIGEMGSLQFDEVTQDLVVGWVPDDCVMAQEKSLSVCTTTVSSWVPKTTCNSATPGRATTPVGVTYSQSQKLTFKVTSRAPAVLVFPVGYTRFTPEKQSTTGMTRTTAIKISKSQLTECGSKSCAYFELLFLCPSGDRPSFDYTVFYE